MSVKVDPVKLKLASALILMMLADPAKAEQYFCAADRDIGFIFDEAEGEWIPDVFDTNAKYLISMTDDFGRARVFGEDWSLICQATNDLSGSEDIICGDLTSQINLNTESLRFTRSNNFGYIHGDDVQQSPSISIGTCLNVDEDEVTPSTDTDAPTIEDLFEAMIKEAMDEASQVFEDTIMSPTNSQPLTANEVDSLIADVRACWNVGALSREAQRIVVTVRTELTEEGRVDAGSIELINATSGSEAAIMQAFEGARRAILRCGASGFNLPPEKYDRWQTLEFVFNPEQMRLR